MNITTNNRFNVCRNISALRLVSATLGILLIASIPTLAHAQKETLPGQRPPVNQLRFPERPIELKPIEARPLAPVKPLAATVTLPALPKAPEAMTVAEIVDYKLALIAADIQHLKDQIGERQQRENDITTGKIHGADPQQLARMKADDQSDLNQIKTLDAEAKAIPKMKPKAQLILARANFNSHISKLKQNKGTVDAQIKQIKQRPPNKVSLAALSAAEAQSAQDEKDIKTLTGMSDAASGEINKLK